MYRQAMFTSHPSVEPTLCSSLISKMGFKSRKRRRSEYTSTIDKTPEDKDEIGSKSEKDKKQKNENCKEKIHDIIKKLKRVSGTLTPAVQSSDAFEEGMKKCKTCAMDAEEYKKIMQSSRIVELLVDSIVEKEQAELINKDLETENVNDEGSKFSSKKEPLNGNGKKITFKFEVYCERSDIKHNLKCVLINLQKSIGDTMAQICFVKTKKLENEERYKVFNVSIRDLKRLKYEYSSLTDKIIPLFKKPIENKNEANTICIACIKEKLTDYNSQLVNFLKSGRNLKLSFQSEMPKTEDDTDKKCCSRNYSHVHAMVEGKPLVLKYSLPFEIMEPKDITLADDDRGSEVNDDDHDQISSTSEESKKDHLSRKGTPYYEWPEDSPQPDPYENEDLQNFEDSTPHPPLPTPISQMEPQESYNLDDEKSPTPVSQMEPQESHNLDDEKSPTPISQIEPQKSHNLDDEKSPTPCSQIEPQESHNLEDEKTPIKKLEDDNEKPQSFNELFEQLGIEPKSNPDLQKNMSDSGFSKERSQLSSVSSSHKPTEQNDIVAENIRKSLSQLCSVCSSHKPTEQNDIAAENTKKNQQSDHSMKSALSEETSSEFTWGASSNSDDSIGSHSNKKVKFSQQKNPTVLPLLVSNSRVSRKSSQHSTIPAASKNKNNIAKTLFDNDTGNCQVFVSEQTELKPFADVSGIPLTCKDSLILSKKRLSHSESKTLHSQGSKHSFRKPVAESVKRSSVTFAEEPKFVDDEPLVADTENITNPKPPLKEIRHQNKKVEEFLKMLGKENLLAVSSPPDCCSVNNFLVNYGSTTDLPICASLNSLPLNYEDLVYIAEAVGKHVSQHAIKLEPEEEISINEYEWEKLVADDQTKNDTKWSRAFAGTEAPSNLNIYMAALSEEKPGLSKKPSVKHVSLRLDPTILPTINEEDSFDGGSFPYLPSIGSLPLDEEEKEEVLRRTENHSLPKHTTMELMYFTVEFPSMLVRKFMSNKTSTPKANNPCTSQGEIFNLPKDLNKKSKLLRKTNKFNSSYNPIHSGRHSNKIFGIGNNKNNKLNPGSQSLLNDSELNPTDEMIMLNAIYASDNSVENKNMEDKSKYSLYNVPEDSFKAKSINHSENDISCLTKPPQQISSVSYTILRDSKDGVMNEMKKGVFLNEGTSTQTDIKEVSKKVSYTVNSTNCAGKTNSENLTVSNCYVKPKNTKLNKSYTVITNIDTQVTYSKHMNPTRNDQSSLSIQHLKKKSNFVDVKQHNFKNLTAEQKQNSKMYNKPTIEANIALVSPHQTDKTIKSDKTTKSSTDQNICTFKKSYTVINDQHKQRSDCNTKHDQGTSTKSSDITSNVYFSQKYIGLKDNSFPRNMYSNLNQKSDHVNKNLWPRANMKNENVKYYIAQQRKATERNRSPMKKDVCFSSIRSLKRKPYVPVKSQICYRRMECSVKMPPLHFTEVRPIKVQAEIPCLMYTSNNLICLENNRINADKVTISQTVCRLPVDRIENKCLSSLREKTLTIDSTEHSLNKNDNKEKKLVALFLPKEPQLSETISKFEVKNIISKNRQETNPTDIGNDNFNTVNTKNEYNIAKSKNQKMQNLSKSKCTESFNSKCLLKNNSINDSSVAQSSEFFLTDEYCNPLYLYDINGRPLTDNSGRPLQSIRGESLMIYDEEGIPISDTNNNPIFDTFGSSLNDDNFNPIKRKNTTIMKSFITSTGDPMVLYDANGWPLTSISGTMLVDSSGKEMIRFGCVGNPISDFQGKPVFSSKGRHVTDGHALL